MGGAGTRWALSTALSAAAAVSTANPARAAPAQEPRSISVPVTAPAEPAIGPGPQHRILYLHRDGGIYTPGWDDSSQDQASVLDQTSTIPPARLSEAEWNSVFDCVESIYAPFAITVTDVEPPPEVAYVQSVVGGRPGDAGFEKWVLGVSAIAGNCSVIERGVNFTFSDMFYSPTRGEHDVEHLCWTITQESGHSLGLDHVLHCPDPMSYLQGCGDKGFTDVDAACGEDEERTCWCGSATQNSVQHLLATLGPADDIFPTVELLTPRDGDTVPVGFAIEAAAADQIELDESLTSGRVDRVELWIDGAPVATAEAEPYQFESPPLEVGAHTVEVRAYDGHENEATASAQVTVEAECEVAGDCPAGSDCEAKMCVAAGESAPAYAPSSLGGCAVSRPRGDASGGAGGLVLAFLAASIRPRRRSRR